VTTPKKPLNDRTYARESTKNKDVATKRHVHTTDVQSRHWWRQSATRKWLTILKFHTCWSQNQG